MEFDGSLQEVVGRAVRLVEELKSEKPLAACDGNKTKTARELDVSYKTLLNKVRELGIR